MKMSWGSKKSTVQILSFLKKNFKKLQNKLFKVSALQCITKIINILNVEFVTL